MCERWFETERFTVCVWAFLTQLSSKTNITGEQIGIFLASWQYSTVQHLKEKWNGEGKKGMARANQNEWKIKIDKKSVCPLSRNSLDGGVGWRAETQHEKERQKCLNGNYSLSIDLSSTIGWIPHASTPTAEQVPRNDSAKYITLWTVKKRIVENRKSKWRHSISKKKKGTGGQVFSIF